MSLIRAIIKAAVLFVLIHLAWGIFDLTPRLGAITFYNGLIPGRERLPYGEDPAAYNLSLADMGAMFASHRLAQPKAPDEYRVVLIGDSSTWGILLRPEQTYAGQLDALKLIAADGRRMRFYNLGYPTLSLLKDLMILDQALAYQPDQVIWLTTLQSFDRSRQFDSPITRQNPTQAGRWLSFEAEVRDPTLIGQRRAIADWLRLQLYGVMWGITGVDQVYPVTYTPAQTDFEVDLRWNAFASPQPLGETELWFEALRLGVTRAGPVPIAFVNMPILISTGVNRDLRYNAYYPRWAYDHYRALYAQIADEEGWQYLDLWDLIAPTHFTDTAVHLSPEGAAILSDRLLDLLSMNPIQTLHKDTEMIQSG
ncbi:MAG: SGNH/GDSL hydrolase family protein [Anaerolineae bacterium]|nr:SGNH/GDSL hydrolase family protein [Anaerolineae bacterium]